MSAMKSLQIDSERLAHEMVEIIKACQKQNRPWRATVLERVPDEKRELVIAYCNTQYRVTTNKYGGCIVDDPSNPFAALRNALVE